MAEIHDQLKAEGIVKDTFGTMLRGRRGLIGRLYLTEQRLVFLQANQFLSAFGAIGGVLLVTIKPRKVGASIPLSSITSVERSKFGLNKNVLTVHHGEAEPTRFAVKYEEWEQALAGKRSQPVTAAAS